jgi:DNA-binding MarR family transcriptional regulator
MSAGHDRFDQVDRIQAEWRRERPDLDVGPHGVIGRLLRLSGIQTDQFELLYKRFGLNLGEFAVLTALRRAGAPFERTPGELAAATMVTTGGMTKRLDSLERGGLVVRRPATSDGRGRIIVLTPAGHDLIDRVFAEHVSLEHRLVESLTPTQVAGLEELLAAWLAALEPRRRQ